MTTTTESLPKDWLHRLGLRDRNEAKILLKSLAYAQRERRRVELSLVRKAKEAHRRENLSHEEKLMNSVSTLQRKGEELKREARAAYIAYGYLREKSFSDIENSSRTFPDWTAVERIIRTELGSGLRVFFTNGQPEHTNFLEWKKVAITEIKNRISERAATLATAA